MALAYAAPMARMSAMSKFAMSLAANLLPMNLLHLFSISVMEGGWDVGKLVGAMVGGIVGVFVGVAVQTKCCYSSWC